MALILIVEDDEANQELVKIFLKRAGHSVLQARDGLTGVLAAREHLPDLIVMDLELPGGLDGLEAASQIRASVATAHVPIIALTANALSEIVHKAKDIGFDAYETKPVIYQRLMKRIGELMSRRSIEHAAPSFLKTIGL